MDLRVEGTLLTAAVEDRTLTYRLLPFGEPGRTSLGLVSVGKGAVTVPEDVTTLAANLEHDPKRPVAKFVSVTEEDGGLSAVLRVLPTTAGNDLLIEASEGVRTGISVEVADPVIRGGNLLAGSLSGAGMVVSPAFPSALLVAADTEAVVDEDGTVVVTTPSATVTVTVSPTQEDPVDPEAPTTEVTASAAPATAPAALIAHGTTSTQPRTPGTVLEASQHMAATLHAIAEGGDRQALMAALTDITYTAIGADVSMPEWIGRLWSGVGYQRVITPQLTNKPLTALKSVGWKWTTPPAMSSYAGDKAAITSNTVATDPFTSTASRLAGGHDHDRSLVDFNEPTYWEAYFAAMTESYARLTDAAALAEVKAGATAVTAGAVPTGVSASAAALVDGALAVLPVGIPTFAFVAANVYRGLLLAPVETAVEALSKSLGLSDSQVAGFTVVPSAALTAGDVIVGVKAAVTYKELGGGAPIRVDAIDISKGGVDTGVFGYYDVIIENAAGLALITGVTP